MGWIIKGQKNIYENRRGMDWLRKGYKKIGQYKPEQKRED